ncbi:MAG: hypothetical protein J7647_19895 [Cyanobacteria bacterium SBLK]|nr:hypothetical protein [Cyanobacteria bacterium SBLK]
MMGIRAGKGESPDFILSSKAFLKHSPNGRGIYQSRIEKRDRVGMDY